MQTTTKLPENYKEICKIDLQHDKKTFILLNVLNVAIFAAMVLIAFLFVPMTISLELDNLLVFYVKLLVLIVGMIAYLILHELVHGIFMKRFSGVKPHYGFVGYAAYAGSDAYFNKVHYIIIALAPIVIWGIVLLIINLVVPVSWFWAVYLIQAINISGAVGDLYVTYKMSKMPADILINDTGLVMTIFSAEN